MHSGDASTTTGLYRSDCACRAHVEVGRGEAVPACPCCGKTVAWMFQRGTFVPPKPADAAPPRAAAPAPRKPSSGT